MIADRSSGLAGRGAAAWVGQARGERPKRGTERRVALAYHETELADGLRLVSTWLAGKADSLLTEEAYSHTVSSYC